MKICFATDVNYPNYTKRIQTSSLKFFIDKKLYDYDISYYISTNMVEDLIHLDGINNVKIFDNSELRKNNLSSLEFEKLPEDPNGIYPSKYPWNIRRFVIEQAANDGFNYIIYIDSDTILKENIESDEIYNQIISKFENNHVKTNNSIFEYSKESNAEHFSQHSNYIDYFKKEFNDYELNTLDKPCMVFMSDDSKNIIELINNWHNLTEFGYVKQNGFGYGNNVHANLSFVIPLSNFKLKFDNFPFFPNHNVEDRYSYKSNNLINEETVVNLHNNDRFSKLNPRYVDLYECNLKDVNRDNFNSLEIGVEKHLKISNSFFENSNLVTEEIFISDPRDFNKSSEDLNDNKFKVIIDISNRDENERLIIFQNYYRFLDDDGFYFIEGVNESDVIIKYLEYGKYHYRINENLLLIRNVNIFNCSKNDIITYVEDVPLPFEHYKNEIENTNNFSINGNKFADKGFFINLEKSKERFENVQKQIEDYNIDGLLRFKALTDEMIQFSCTKSHLSIFDLSKKLNLNSIFVAEDDFQIDNKLFMSHNVEVDFFEKIEQVKKDLDMVKWDVFLFGCNPKDYLTPITNNLAIVKNSTGAWAYIIKKRAYEYLMENLHYKKDYIAIDDYLPLLSSKGFITVTSIPLTIGHAVGYVSTLQPNGPVNYTEWIRGSYQKFLYDDYPYNNFID